MSPAEGVDLSAYQHGADLARVAGAGMSFVIAKATEGITETDLSFAGHVVAAKRAGMLTGAYHFFRTTSDPRGQVRRFVEVVANAGGVDLPLALDVEWQHDEPGVAAALGGLSPGAFGDAAVTAMQELAEQLARRPLLYTAPGFWALLPLAHRQELALLSDLWLAEPTRSPAPPLVGFERWAFWQFTSSAPVPGIAGAADVNRFCDDVVALRLYARTGKLPPALDPPIDVGTTWGVQRALNRLGASPKLAEDDELGPATTAAVKAFQRAHGLVDDGRVGPATRAALKIALAALGAP